MCWRIWNLARQKKQVAFEFCGFSFFFRDFPLMVGKGIVQLTFF